MLECPWCGQLCKGLIGLENHQYSCKKKLEKDYSYIKKSGSDAIFSFDPNEPGAIEVAEMFHKFEEQQKSSRNLEKTIKKVIEIQSTFKEGVISIMKKYVNVIEKENMVDMIKQI